MRLKTVVLRNFRALPWRLKPITIVAQLVKTLFSAVIR